MSLLFTHPVTELPFINFVIWNIISYILLTQGIRQLRGCSQWKQKVKLTLPTFTISDRRVSAFRKWRKDTSFLIWTKREMSTGWVYLYSSNWQWSFNIRHSIKQPKSQCQLVKVESIQYTSYLRLKLKNELYCIWFSYGTIWILTGNENSLYRYIAEI